MKKTGLHGWPVTLVLVVLSFGGASISQAEQDCGSEKILTILGTNDLHGSIEPTITKDGAFIGGLSFFDGVSKAIREGVQKKLTSECTGSLLVDAGDQFQGTLLSNHNEGALMFDLMGEIGYDAVVPGNHDYDFGPIGWLVDQVEASKAGNPREVIEKLAKTAKFPLLSANTYLKKTIKDITGKDAEINSVGCASEKILDWSGAKRPDFLQPYVIKTVAGIRVALVGLDNVQTPNITTPANVSDLCFRQPVEEYLSLRKEIKDLADVFVIITHEGDAEGTFNLSNLIKAIQEKDPEAVDAVIAGHTHQINQLNFNGVPAIQSAANGQRFGRIDLVFDTATKKVVRSKTKFLAGALLTHTACDKKTAEFCAYTPERLAYENEPVIVSAKVDARIADERKLIAPIADRPLGTAEKTLNSARYEESPLGDILVDGMRETAGVPIAFINSGGIRAPIQAGKVTFEELFRVLPFNNHAVVIGPMNTSALVRILIPSMKSCGAYGFLPVSGLRVTFQKDCTTAKNGIDENAKLLTVYTDAGEKIYDGRGNVPEITEKLFQVVTLDFLYQGGDRYDAFKGYPLLKDLGVFREVLADHLAAKPGQWKATLDGRWSNGTPAAPSP